MKFLRVMIIAVPLVTFGACKQEGAGPVVDVATNQPRSGGYNPENTSASHTGMPSQFPSKNDAGGSRSDLGLAREGTVPPLPPPAPPTPPSQKNLPAQKGAAGGTLK